MQAVEAEQPPLRLVHHAPHGAEIVTEVAGAEAGRAGHRASSDVALPAIRWKLDCAVPGGAPTRWTLWSDGQRAASAEFLPEATAGTGPDDPPTLADDAGAACASLDRAIATKSLPLLLDASAAFERMHAAHAIPDLAAQNHIAMPLHQHLHIRQHHILQ